MLLSKGRVLVGRHASRVALYQTALCRTTTVRRLVRFPRSWSGQFEAMRGLSIAPLKEEIKNNYQQQQQQQQQQQHHHQQQQQLLLQQELEYIQDELQGRDFYFPKPQGLIVTQEDVIMESEDKSHTIFRCKEDNMIVIHCSLGWIVRHGPSDGVVTLDVGGTTFHTLRSTLVSSRVLAELYANSKLYQRHLEDDKLFIDRDAATFHLVLTYLRNRLEDLSHASTFLKTPSSLNNYLKKETFVDLPQDHKILREVYLESVFFGLDDFRDEICSKSLFIRLSSWFSGGKNPFDQLAQSVRAARRVAVSASLVAGGHISTGGEVPDVLKPVAETLSHVFSLLV